MTKCISPSVSHHTEDPSGAEAGSESGIRAASRVPKGLRSPRVSPVPADPPPFLSHSSTSPSPSRRRMRISDAPISFSWTHSLVNAFAYIWLLSNFLRTGLAIHDMDAYHTVQPDVYINFGPYAYPVNTFFKWSENLDNVTSADDIALWSYKFDTTSLAIRAFAEFLNVSAFPKCVLYKGDCHGGGSEITATTGYLMLDALVDAIRDATIPSTKTSAPMTQDAKFHHLQPQTMHVGANYVYFDRIHHYLAPEVFTTPLWRTCRALYYSPEVLASAAASSRAARNQLLQGNDTVVVDVCSAGYGGVRPYFCDNLWARFSRSCYPGKDKCAAVGRLSNHLTSRLAKLKAAYPNATVDMTIIEGSKGIDIHRGGRVFVSTQANDVVTLFRVRDCSASSGGCDTKVIDEYRYEGETFTTEILGWHSIVMTLRGAAQTYYWIRLITLFLGCYFAVAARSDKTRFLARIHKSLVMFFKIPSQVIVYGSTFPLACYLMAHIIDAPIVYELTSQRFTSFNGLFKLSLAELVTISSVQMRNVWVLAGFAHVIVRIATQRSWSPLHGIWGMPQFSIALISSLTILSQFRYISLRSMPIRSIQEIDVLSRLHPSLEELLNANGGGGKSSLGGVFLDLKAVCCSALALFVLASVCSLLIKCAFPRLRLKLIFGRSYSFTPLSAGILWPTSSLAVSWNDDLFHFHRIESALVQKRSSTKSQSVSNPTLRPTEISTLDERSDIAEATMYLMNITMLSDPIVFLSWKWYSSSKLLGYYRSNATQRVYLVPVAHTLNRTELCWANFTCVRTVSADELTWSERQWIALFAYLATHIRDQLRKSAAVASIPPKLGRGVPRLDRSSALIRAPRRWRKQVAEPSMFSPFDNRKIGLWMTLLIVRENKNKTISFVRTRSLVVFHFSDTALHDFLAMNVFAFKVGDWKVHHHNASSLSGISAIEARPVELSNQQPAPCEEPPRKLVSDDPIPFSWVQFVISTCAYVWLLSNFLRTGVAVHNFDGYRALEPDVYSNLGPYAYSVNTLFKWSDTLDNVTSASDNTLWNYKYDTTSIGMRAFAEFLNVSAFPTSVLYKADSDPEDIVETAQAYLMLNSLVDAIRDVANPSPASTPVTPSANADRLRPRSKALRVQYEFFDRIHHYLIPQIFSTPAWRTCQALHYSSALLALAADQQRKNGTLADVCSTSYGGVRPYFCGDLWTRFSRSCRSHKPKCAAVGHVSAHLIKRLETLKTAYPNSTVDMTIVESSRDIDIYHGGLVFVGKRSGDVVTLFRVQTCTSTGDCDTQVIDEYRYEVETFATDMLAWYPLVATLRGAAQTYYWLRLIMLYLGCYFAVAARGEEPAMSLSTKIRKGFAVFYKIPSQVIIYGSTFPLMCYLMAHFIDSPIVYELTAQKFDSLSGLIHLSLMELVTISSIQMRNIWVLAGFAHVVVRIATLRTWSPLRGVWGMPQFSIALISSLTIISQFRYKSLRRTPVTYIRPADVVSRLHPTLDTIANLNNDGKATLGGIFLDVKAVGCSVAVLVVFAGIVALAFKCACPRSSFQLVFWRSYSYTPLSAGILWPTSTLAVSWNDDLFQFNRIERAVIKTIPSGTTIRPINAQTVSQQMARPIEVDTLDGRSDVAEAVMYLMNITMLTDPILFLSWRWSSSETLVRYYRSKKTRRTYLVPIGHPLHRTELSWTGYTNVRTVSADKLPWSEVITCG